MPRVVTHLVGRPPVDIAQRENFLLLWRELIDGDGDRLERFV
jgi:hypothetical protein